MTRHKEKDNQPGGFKAPEHHHDEERAARDGIESSSAGTEDAQTEDRSGDQLEEQIRSAEDEAKRHYDKLLRVMAEFENFKKRMHREKAEHAQYSNEKILNDLLPVLDDLDRVVDHVPENASPEIQSLITGLELIRKNMIATLAKYGLREIEALGKPFDPSLHEAVSTGSGDGFEPNSVMDVHRKGYMLDDRLLRAAMVTVAN